MATVQFLQSVPRDRPRHGKLLGRLICVGLIAVAGLSVLSFVALHQAPLPEEKILIAVAEWSAPARPVRGP
jgi:hypothetical protein